MRASEFLLEYNRQVTAKQVGNRLLLALSKDSSIFANGTLNGMRTQIKTLGNLHDPEALNAVIDPIRRAKWIEYVLQVIESLDPTPNKAYTPWLAKMYAKGGLKLEDMNRNGALEHFDLAKKKKKVAPEHADINRFKTYKDFEDVVLSRYQIEPEEKENTPAKAKKSQLRDCLVIIPEDEEAAIKYGKGTKWCTSAIKNNYFGAYNRKGPLFIIIPKNPKYAGEKYQVHFETGSYMNEQDNPVNLIGLYERFPDLIPFFKKNAPGFKDGRYKDKYGDDRYYKNNMLHREDGPAVERAGGSQEWYLDGKRHRTDGPAVENADGSREWYLDGKYHRVDGPAIERADGSKYWYLNGKLHREDGPAVEWANGSKFWYLHGKYHRVDGPAVERADGTKEWWLNGKELSKKQFDKIMSNKK